MSESSLELLPLSLGASPFRPQDPSVDLEPFSNQAKEILLQPHYSLVNSCPSASVRRLPVGMNSRVDSVTRSEISAWDNIGTVWASRESNEWQRQTGHVTNIMKLRDKFIAFLARSKTDD